MFTFIRRRATALNLIILAASLLVLLSNDYRLRYVWADGRGDYDGVWLGSGEIGYITYVDVWEPGDPPKDYPHTVGWSIGRHFSGGIRLLPQWCTGVFGVRVRTVPIWPICAVSGVLFVRRLARALRYRARKLAGDCLMCGYNLTGNVSGICPECATPIVEDTTMHGDVAVVSRWDHLVSILLSAVIVIFLIAAAGVVFVLTVLLCDMMAGW